jgi:arylsulfatase A-like enzyme
MHLDRDVGRLLDLLESDDALNSNTLFVFTSDNGSPLGSPFDFTPFANTGGLRGKKATVFEGGLRVPTV